MSGLLSLLQQVCCIAVGIFQSTPRRRVKTCVLTGSRRKPRETNDIIARAENANCTIPGSLLQKYSCPWRRVQPNVRWNCLATACAVGAILCTPGLSSRLGSVFPSSLPPTSASCCLGWQVRVPTAQLLTSLFSSRTSCFQPVQCLSFHSGFFSLHIYFGWPRVNLPPTFGGAELEQNTWITENTLMI